MKNYCRLYIVRHGQTDWNVKGLLQGHTDMPLTITGEEQAKQLAKKLKKIKFAIGFSSDLLRAKRTAEIIALEKKIAVRTTKALRERSFGKYEGINWREDRKFHELVDKYLYVSQKELAKKKVRSEIESNDKVLARIIPLLREIAVFYTGKNVLVVSHGGVIRVLIGHVIGKSLKHGSVDNTAYARIDSDGVDFFVKEMSGIRLS